MPTYQIKNSNSAKILGIKICIISTGFKTTLALFSIAYVKFVTVTINVEILLNRTFYNYYYFVQVLFVFLKKNILSPYSFENFLWVS